jgi:hypothetical protein
MSLVPSSDDFRQELRAQIDRAVRRGASHVEINAGELHRTLGAYPGPNHRMPLCCKAMQEECLEGDEMIFSPDKGQGASLTIRYKIPRTAKVVPLRKS